MKLKEIPRTATFAWSPAAESPLLATGTAAGAVDADFSTATALELWPLDLRDHSVAAFMPETPRARVETDARFHDLAFNRSGDIVVGALESGVVEAWKVSSPDNVESVAKATQPGGSGPVRSVQFSSLSQKLASGGSSGQVYVWDLAHGAQGLTTESAHSPGAASGGSRHGGDVASVAWNNHSAQILAAAGSNGFTTIYDTNRKREVLHLHYASPTTGSPVPLSTVQWHPVDSTRLLTASLDDNEPVILVWNLRNVNVPEKVLRGGHTKGVLSVDWCRQDPELLLSGGRDNATLLWNPEKSTLLGSYPLSVEWAFKTKFHPTMPDLFATASFDGKVTVQTLQDTTSTSSSATTTTSTAAKATTDGDDFWSSTTVMDSVHPEFALQQAPAWLRRPISAKFGFGGKLAIARKENVIVTQVKDESLGAEQVEFSKHLQAGSLDKIAEARSGEDWELLQDFVASKDVTERLPSGKELEKIDLPEKPDTELTEKFSLDDEITRVLLEKDFAGAVARLLRDKRSAEALVVATYASDVTEQAELVDLARSVYASEHATPVLRAAKAVSTSTLTDLAINSDLSEWATVLRSLLSLEESQRRSLARTLGDRLRDAGQRADAVLAYLLGGSVAGAAKLWLSELPQLEADLVALGSVSAYEAHVQALQTVVEKITVALNTAATAQGEEEDVDAMHGVLRDYANITASQGDLALAKVYLDMLPDKYSQDKDRVQRATESPAKLPKVRGARNGALAGAPQLNATNPYGLPQPTQPVSPRAPRAHIIQGATAPSVATSAPAPPVPLVPVAQPVIPPPTRAPAPSEPRANSSSGGWNDLPELGPTQRRTPVAPQIITPSFSTPAPPSGSRQASASGPPGPPSSQGATPASASTHAPPPPPSSSTSASAGGYAPSGSYAPGGYSAPGGYGAPMAATPIAQTPSVPLSNPYASRSAVRSGTSSRSNPYAPPQSTAAPTPGPVTTPSPAPVSSTPAALAPRPGPARASAPPRSTAPPRAPSSAPSPSIVAPAAATAPSPSIGSPSPVVSPPPASKAKHPKGDRSHIDAADKPVIAALDKEYDRVTPIVGAKYQKQLKDTRARLNILYDHLNNHDLLDEHTLGDLRTLAGQIGAGDYDGAQAIVDAILSDRSTQGGSWVMGVRRLIQMGRAIPPSA